MILVFEESTIGNRSRWRKSEGNDRESTANTNARSHPAFVGTYTEDGQSEGICRSRLDAMAGALERLGATSGDENPSFLARDPAGKHRYAEDADTGEIVVLRIDRETGRLTATGRVESVPSPVYRVMLPME